MSVIDEIAYEIDREAHLRGGYAELARGLDVPYDALYQLGTGRRQRSVDVSVLVKIARQIPSVGSKFVNVEVR